MCNFLNKKTINQVHSFQPKLIIAGDLVPAVKTGDSFRYLGRYFDFNMSNATHKSELCETLTSILTKVDFLPLHPRNKIVFIIGIYSLNSLGSSLLPLFLKLGYVNIWTMLLLNAFVNG